MISDINIMTGISVKLNFETGFLAQRQTATVARSQKFRREVDAQH
jgi:hypothetical protein